MLITIYDRAGNPKAELSPNDSSTQVKEVQGDNVLTLSFTLYDHIALDVYDYADFEGERYWLTERYRPKQKSTGEWAYDLKLYGIESLIKNWLVLKTVDNEQDPLFTLTAPPRDHVAMIVKCMNDACDNITDWKVGQVNGTENITIDYFGKYCDEGLREIAEKVGAEFWTEGQTVNICRCEHGEPVTLGYDKGLLSIDPGTANNVKFYTRLFPKGSSRNIDPSKYGYSRLQLPDGQKYIEVYSDEYGIVDHYEESAFADIYPRRTGTVSSIRSEVKRGEDGKDFTIYYFRDNSLPFDPNDYMIGGKVIRVSFQEGSELAGQGDEENGTYYFEVNFDSKTREFEIITIWPYDNDMQLPGDKLITKPGDKYILWNLRMPDEYYSLAEEELLTAVNAFNSEHTLDIAVFKALTDHAWIEENAVRLSIGQRVRLESDKYFPGTGYRDSRITRITRKVNLPSCMDLEISDALSRSAMQKVSDSIGETKRYVQSIADSISLPDIIRTGDKTRPTDNNLLSALRVIKDFISKQKDDRTAHKLSSDKAFEVGEYAAGVSGGMLGIDAAGESFAEVGRLWVRVRAYFEELTVIKAGVLAGKQYITPGGGIKCVKVEETPTAWRCWFLSEQDGEATECKFTVGDQAIAEEFNVRAGTAGKTGNRRYWRLVVAVNNDARTDGNGNHYGYIDLSKTDCEPGSDTPKAGDDICQLGYRGTDNPQRQTAMVFSTVDADAPSVKLFSGINSYSLAGKAGVSFGQDAVTGRIYFRLGASEAKQFLEYTQDGGLTVAGRISSLSTVDDGSGSEQLLKDILEDKVVDTDVLFISHGSADDAPVLPVTDANGVITDAKGWQTTAPEWRADRYIWQTTYVRKGDGTASFSDPTCIQGAKGEQGPQGIPGKAGADGQPTYTWIRYADDANGGGMSNDPAGKKYMGLAYNKPTAAESNNPADYAWSLIKGDKGDQGVPGQKGADGTQYWTWIKYSDNPDGTGMYDTPNAHTKYIGIAVNKTSQTESNTPSDYTWSMFQGPGYTNNLLLNSAFIYGFDNWSIGPYGVSVNTAHMFESRKSVRILQSGLTANQWRGISQSVPAAPGEVFTASIWSFAENPSSIDNGAEMEVWALNSSKDRIGDAVKRVNIKPSKANEWQQAVAVNAVMPANTAYVQVYAWVRRNGALWLSSPKLERGVNPAPQWSPAAEEMVGTPAQVVVVNADALVFQYENGFATLLSPQKITLSATVQGIANPTYQWSYRQADQTGFTDITAAYGRQPTLEVNPNGECMGNAESSTVRCTVNGTVHDEVTIARVSSGSNGASYSANLLTGTRDWSGATKKEHAAASVTTEEYAGLRVMTTGAYAWSTFYWTAEVEEGVEYTMSAWAYCTEDNVAPALNPTNWNAPHTSEATVTGRSLTPALNRWSRIWFTFRCTRSGSCVVSFENKTGAAVKFAGWKLEEGVNRSPQWSPAAAEMTGADYTENLLLGSGTAVTNSLYPTQSYRFSAPPVEGKTYTCTLWGRKGPNPARGFAVFNSNGYVVLADMKEVEDGVYRATFKWKVSHPTHPADNTHLRVYETPHDAGACGPNTIDRIKLEEGDNPKPVWTPAPSDSDAYTVILTNESHIFEGDTEKAVAGSTECGVIAYKGNMQVAATIDASAIKPPSGSMPAGMSVAVSGIGTTSAKFTVTVTTALKQRQGTLNVPVTVDDRTFTKVFSWSLSLQGKARSIYLRGTQQNRPQGRILKVDGNTIYSSGSGRGVRLVTLDRQTLAKVDDTTYDTYNSPANRAALVTRLESLDDSVFVTLTSCDAIGMDAALNAALNRFGGMFSDVFGGDRRALAFIGYKGLQPGYAQQVMDKSAGTAVSAYAEVSVYVADGMFTTSKTAVGIDHIVEEYYLSTSRETTTGDYWRTSAPVWQPDRYIWTRSHVYYTDGTDATYGEVCSTGASGFSYAANMLGGAGRQLDPNTAYQLGAYDYAEAPVPGKTYTLTVCYKVGAKDTSIAVFVDNKGYYKIKDLTARVETVEAFRFTCPTPSNSSSPKLDRLAFFHQPNDGDYDGTNTYVKWAVLVEGDNPARVWVPSAAEMATGVNELRNATFANSSDHWAMSAKSRVDINPGFAGAGVNSAVWEVSGDTSRHWRGISQGTFNAAGEPNTDITIPTSPGDVWTASVHTLCPDFKKVDDPGDPDAKPPVPAGTVTLENRAMCEIQFYNASGAKIKTVQYSIMPTEQEKWQRHHLTVVAPDGAAYVGLYHWLLANGTLYMSKPMLSRGATLGDWTPSPLDTSYLQQALQNDASLEGGLVLATLASMGYKAENGEYVTMAGISGIYDANKPGGGIAFWGGGPMVDLAEHYYWDSTDNEWKPRSNSTPPLVAKFIDRMDGSGYRARGNLWWDEEGNTTFVGAINAVGSFGGLFRKRKTVLTKSNYEQYTRPIIIPGHEHLNIREFAWEAVGQYIEIQSLPSVKTFYLPNDVSLVGETVIIVNKWTQEVGVSGYIALPSLSPDVGTQSFAIPAGYCAAYTAKLKIDSSNGLGKVVWELHANMVPIPTDWSLVQPPA